jgi:putative oxidoreductase
MFSDVEDAPPRNIETQWHGGLDFALLILRIVLGGTMGAHGLQHLFGVFGGPGVAGFARTLSTFGFTAQTTLLSWITGIAEVAGGALLILGLFTPLAAAAVLGVTVNVVYAKFHGGFFLGHGNSAGGGFEFELVLAALSLALLFTGAGRVSLDVNTPWRKKPTLFALLGVLLATAASVAVIMLFR